MVHREGGTHTRWTTQNAVASAGVMLFKGPQARQYTQKAVHTQGGTHKRQSVATTSVMLFQGPQARQYTQKAVHTKHGLWPPRESCYLRGHRQGGTHTRRCTHKAVCGHHRSLVVSGARGGWPPCRAKRAVVGGVHQGGGYLCPTVKSIYGTKFAPPPYPGGTGGGGGDGGGIGGGGDFVPAIQQTLQYD